MSQNRVAPRWISPVLVLVLSVAASVQVGCAFKKIGPANVAMSSMSVPSGLIGLNKEQVVQKLGDPDYVLPQGSKTYWGYRNANGWFVWLYYVSFGKTEAKDLVVELEHDKVQTAYLVDKGSSVGILALPMSVAN